MTRDETKKILARIEASFPNWKPRAPLSLVIDTWYEMLSDYTYEQVLSGVKFYVLSDTSGFAPTIGQVVESIRILYEKDQLNCMDAWGLVLKAIRNSVYHADEEFKKLPSAAKKAVASPYQLREWAMLENVNGNGLTVLQSNFMKLYREEQAKERQIKKFSIEHQKLNLKTEHKLLAESNKRSKQKETIRNEIPTPDFIKQQINILGGYQDG